MKKPLILLFTLAVPVALFLFLKFFGDNRYDVPVFFENGIEDCTESPKPFTMDFSRLSDRKGNQPAQNYAVVALIDTMADESLKALATKMIQIQDAFYGKVAPTFIFISEDASPESVSQRLELYVKTGLDAKRIFFALFQADKLMDFLHCGIGLTANGDHAQTDLVLVDNVGRVRGFYARHDEEQTDRLILELKILIQQK